MSDRCAGARAAKARKDALTRGEIIVDAPEPSAGRLRREQYRRANLALLSQRDLAMICFQRGVRQPVSELMALARADLMDKVIEAEMGPRS